MNYQLSDEIRIQQITLKVNSLGVMSRFYQDIVGLELHEINEYQATFGFKGQEATYLILKKISQPEISKQTAGLYHIAFLLPERQDLGVMLQHLLQAGIEIGGADHGYSEALYFSDPEGNGIEIYWDKPRNYWDIREDGQIVGVTDELDGMGLLEEAKQEWTGLPGNASIGHIHLKVTNLLESAAFYENIGFGLKSDFGRQAKFFAGGNYHHHIGMNTWESKGQPKMTEEQLGLAEYGILLPDAESFSHLESQLADRGVKYTKEDDQLRIQDPNGLLLIIAA